jgi:virulence-associated protein VapD
MYIYKDVFSGDELFSDTYPMKLISECLYEVTGQYETRKEGEVVLAGSNASAEEADEGTDEGAVSGIDIVLNHQLVETGFGTKKDFTVYLKDYMKKVVKYLEENDKADQVDSFKKNINGVMKELLTSFSDLQFFTGESMDPEAMIVMCLYKDVGGVEKPVLMFFKHGLEEEKC